MSEVNGINVPVIDRATWNAMPKTTREWLFELICKDKRRSKDKTEHPTLEPVDPSTITRMYCNTQMEECELECAIVNNCDKEYKLALSESNVFCGTLDVQDALLCAISQPPVRGCVHVEWTNCAVQEHDGDLKLAETEKGQSTVKIVIEGRKDVLIVGGKLVEGEWPWFLSVYVNQ